MKISNLDIASVAAGAAILSGISEIQGFDIGDQPWLQPAAFASLAIYCVFSHIRDKRNGK